MLANNKLWIKAFQQLQVPYEILNENGNLFKAEIGEQNYLWANYTTPFNPESTVKIAKDKGFTYQILKNKIKQPKTASYLNPNVEEKYQEYFHFKNNSEICDDISLKFVYPIIIKRNSGFGGNNVFLCQNKFESQKALEAVFENNKNFDYMALVQEKIEIATEYRVIFSNLKNPRLELIYEKNIENARFVGNLSPLHYEYAKAVLVDDKNFERKVFDFCKPIFKEINFGFVGLDLAVDINGNFCLIEINSHPNFDYFLKDNPENMIIKIFMRMLQDIK